MENITRLFQASNRPTLFPDRKSLPSFPFLASVPIGPAVPFATGRQKDQTGPYIPYSRQSHGCIFTIPISRNLFHQFQAASSRPQSNTSHFQRNGAMRQHKSGTWWLVGIGAILLLLGVWLLNMKHHQRTRNGHSGPWSVVKRAK